MKLRRVAVPTGKEGCTSDAPMNKSGSQAKGGGGEVDRKKLPPQGLLKIGEMARLAGVLPSTIRYYTQIGLLEAAATTRGGQKLYSREDTLSKVRMIKSIERQHLPLQTIRKILEDHRSKSF